MITFLYGISAGFSNYFPIIALFGCILLFVVAVPIIVYKFRLGLVFALIACILMLPANLVFAKGILDDGIFNLSMILISLPVLLVLFNIYITIRSIIVKSNEIKKATFNQLTKLLLAGIPIGLFILYIIVYGQYWSLEMFRI